MVAGSAILWDELRARLRHGGDARPDELDPVEEEQVVPGCASRHRPEDEVEVVAAAGIGQREGLALPRRVAAGRRQVRGEERPVQGVKRTSAAASGLPAGTVSLCWPSGT